MTALIGSTNIQCNGSIKKSKKTQPSPKHGEGIGLYDLEQHRNQQGTDLHKLEADGTPVSLSISTPDLYHDGPRKMMDQIYFLFF